MIHRSGLGLLVVLAVTEQYLREILFLILDATVPFGENVFVTISLPVVPEVVTNVLILNEIT